MTLWLVETEFAPPLAELCAWKVLITTPGGLCFPHFDATGTANRARGPVGRYRWLEAVNQPARTIRGERYTSGFHVFAQREHAERWQAAGGVVILPVFVRDVRLQGLHSPEGRGQEIAPELKVYVADRMLIP